MSDEPKQSPGREPLQFDTAEPVAGDAATATSLACTMCDAHITTSYYEVGGAIVCISCRAKLRAQLTGGSGSARFAKAIGFGLVAAAVGCGLYYGVAALTGYEIGLVALVVGFLVGRAVNRGSQGRGGRAYQLLAVGLTYLAIVTTHVEIVGGSVMSLFALAIVAPIVAGHKSIISVVIIGFALFEAWRQNQRLELAFTGPYRVGARRDAQASAEAAGG